MTYFVQNERVHPRGKVVAASTNERPPSGAPQRKPVKAGPFFKGFADFLRTIGSFSWRALD